MSKVVCCRGPTEGHQLSKRAAVRARCSGMTLTAFARPLDRHEDGKCLKGSAI